MRPLIRPSVPLRQLFIVALPALLLLAALTGVYWWHLYSSGKDLRQATLDNAIYRAHQVNSAVSEAVSMLFFNADEAMKPPRKPEPAGSREFQPMESLHEENQIQ